MYRRIMQDFHALLYTVGPVERTVSIGEAFEMLLPGAHAAFFVFRDNIINVSLACRKAGFQLRDTIGVVHNGESEHILLCRTPVEEKTTTEQVLKTRTGAINVESTRVKHSDAADFEKHRAGVEALKAKGGSLGNSWKNSSDLSGANDVTSAGRWPANLLLLHQEEVGTHDACRPAGSVKVAAPIINRFTDGMKPFGDGAGHAYESVKTGDAEGNETITKWACSPSCDVATLDRQSNGGSRFFQQVTSWDEIHDYMAKMLLPSGGKLLVV